MNLLNKIFGCYNAYCLLLDKRIEFWQELHSSFLDKGINLQRFLVGDGGLNQQYDHIDINIIPPYFSNSTNYGTWYKSPAPLNAWLSHRKIIEKSLLEGFDHVMIIEDDAVIESDFDEILNKSADFFLSNKWDSVYFGSYQESNGWSLTSNENVIRSNHCCGWHGILLTKPIMEELLTFSPIGPMDYICSNHLNQKYDVFSIYPSIISQKDNNWSFIEGSNLSKPSRFKR